jgi:hypothetical protein
MSAFGGKADGASAKKTIGSLAIFAAENRLLFLAMARAWLKLAEQAIKNSRTVLVYETPVPSGP